MQLLVSVGVGVVFFVLVSGSSDGGGGGGSSSFRDGVGISTSSTCVLDSVMCWR